MSFYDGRSQSVLRAARLSLMSRQPDQRVAIFFSGSGSTLQALLDQQENLNIVCTISSRKGASGRIRCRRAGISEKVFKFPEQAELVLNYLKQLKISTLFLAGFMKILTADFVSAFKNLGPKQQIFNIHPSLLPLYKGLKATETAFAEKAELGVTVHQVVAEVDSGAFVKRKRSLTQKQVKSVQWTEALLWQRASEQDVLRSWGSCIS